MSAVIIGLLALAAVSLGLRTTAMLAGERLSPVTRLLIAIAIGGVLTTAMLQLSDAYDVFELGLGLLLSLSPVGLFDLTKWWFRWSK